MKGMVPTILATGMLAGGVYAVITPVTRGPYPVASTCLAVTNADESLLNRCFCGDRTSNHVWSAEDVLSDVKSFRTVETPLPAEDPLLGKALTCRYFLLYPTTPENRRANRTILKAIVPHVQSPSETLLAATNGAPFPLVIFSHGYGVHPFYDLRDLVTLASHGYIVACVLHADGRFGPPTSYSPLAALRAETLRQVVKSLVTDREFAGVMDTGRIGLFGISLGGAATLTLLGENDHVRAAFGESPALWLNSTNEINNVRQPYFGVVGCDDGLLEVCRKVVPQLSGPRYLVELPGQGHVPTEDTKEQVITTWMLHFFDAYLKDDPQARTLLKSAESVVGAITNTITFRNTDP